MVISQSLASKKYATAYINVYYGLLSKKEVQSIMSAVSFFKDHPNVMFLVCSVALEKKQKIVIVRKILHYFHVSIPCDRLVGLLLKNNDLCLLPTILHDICFLYKKRNNILDVTIKSVELLDEQTMNTFERFFAQQSHKQVMLTTKIDASLIAGIRMQSAIFLWEYSIASRLRSLRQKVFIEG